MLSLVLQNRPATPAAMDCCPPLVWFVVRFGQCRPQSATMALDLDNSLRRLLGRGSAIGKSRDGKLYKLAKRISSGYAVGAVIILNGGSDPGEPTPRGGVVYDLILSSEFGMNGN
jgi:hypothetical protein